MSKNNPSDLNLDLINMVQNARMMHDKTARPSDYAAVYWIEAKRQDGDGDYPALTPNMGEWRVKLHVDEVDTIWEQVKIATEKGSLGYKSKVSTRPAAGQADPDERLLVIRTYSADDTADVERIQSVLVSMGMTDMSYHKDKDR